ncbi:N-succinylarginine dihydrolase [Pantoea sp. Nvir]|uniref:N-succinylarginine dihydrolase n=1 Tax=Pantoea sp. Nvir TaxID=2576760 RepID=UPI001359D6AC|nr:N-succinylarginine dihydrolase [Pantoea sp. Nvir]MXP66220.1 N-succinylarginine dihydrolase [Pantoea sp. Nvir]CAJ0991666.1 N-succinylarginine dihydrolase [Pantoea sp. Nvir]
MKAIEANFDGLVGLTHHYAGLSFGNEASTRHQYQPSNPRLAAKQGLLKMKALSEMGFVQGIVPPHERPNLPLLRQLGYSGSDDKVLEQVSKSSPMLLSAASSASAMWVANAATVSPSADSADGRVHFTVSNLNNKFHRAMEAPQTARLLRAIFRDPQYFAVHDALPHVSLFGDEGAANHNRLGAEYDERNLQIFVYGRDDYDDSAVPARYPARQTLQASQAVSRLHQLDESYTLFIQQNPYVIDQGVFHNDVIAVSNREVLFYHQHAFINDSMLMATLEHRIPKFTAIAVPENRVSVADAVSTYLFNSQLLSRHDGTMLLLLPEECHQHSGVWRYLCELVDQGGPIRDLKVCNLRESMHNGGGPACLRLRVVLTAQEQNALNPAVLMNDCLFSILNDWVDRHYRDYLTQADLADPQLLKEGREALDELTQLLNLGSLYPFQL